MISNPYRQTRSGRIGKLMDEGRGRIMAFGQGFFELVIRSFKEVSHIYWPSMEGVPDDVIAEGFFYDDNRRSFCVFFWHESFEQTPQGQQFPAMSCGNCELIELKPIEREPAWRDPSDCDPVADIQRATEIAKGDCVCSRETIMASGCLCGGK